MDISSFEFCIYLCYFLKKISMDISSFEFWIYLCYFKKNFQNIYNVVISNSDINIKKI